jgi:predicted esterase
MGTKSVQGAVEVGRRWAAAGLATLLLGASLVMAAPAKSVTERPADIGPLEAGRAAYVSGHFVWTDYVYDDRGDPPDPSQPDMTAVFGTDQGAQPPYPAGEENTADFVQLQLRPDPGGLQVGALLQTLREWDHPMVGVAFDTDRNPATGAAALPGGSWSPLGPLGVEVLMVLTTDGADLRRFTDGAWSSAGRVDVTVDRFHGSGILRATLPLDVADPAAQVWRTFGVAGIASQSWLEGGPIYDLACVTDVPLRWQSKNQAEILGRRRNSGEAACVVDFAKAGSGVTEVPDPTIPGEHTMLYRSRYDLGGSIVPGSVVIGVQGKDYMGAYQPYHATVPRDVAPRPALIVHMHGVSANHIHGNSYGGLLGLAFSSVHPTTDPPGIANSGAYTYEIPAVVIYPFGRSDTSWEGFHEADLLEAVDDATTRWNADPDRIVLNGASLGGIAAFDIGARNPDRFSYALPVVGRPSDPESLVNFNNLPVAQVNNMLDPLIQQPAPTEASRRLTELGYEHRYWLLWRRGHEHPTQLTECVYLDTISRRRVVDPARVVYRYVPAHDAVDDERRLDLVHDRAYWVSGLKVRVGQDAGKVDATSLAFANRAATGTAYSADHENVTAGRDLCGPRDDVKTSDAWTEEGVRVAPGPAQATTNAAQVSLTELSAATFDVGRMALRTGEPVTLTITGDGPVALRLLGSWPRRATVIIDGVAVPATRSNDALSFTADLTGAHAVVVQPKAVR